MTPLCVSVAEAAEALGISEWMVRHLIARRELPTVKFPSTEHRGETNRRILIPYAALEEYVKAHTETAK